MEKKIKSALISVYHKNGLDQIIKGLIALDITIYSTGGTLDYIKSLGGNPIAVEDLTGYPSIFGGRVKTLHPKVFGGILHRRKNENDQEEQRNFSIPELDLVVVDLYPFEQTVAAGGTAAEIIEKIDIGGISLIRAAAKNFEDVVVIPSQEDYVILESIVKQAGYSSLELRKHLAYKAFAVSSQYDHAIGSYLSGEIQYPYPKMTESIGLRYGENPHQEAKFVGNFDSVFTQLWGKQLSYNNLLDVDAAVNLMADFGNESPTIAILKHNNACGLAQRQSLLEAWNDALAADPVSAFGGVIISNVAIDEATATEINKLFFEVIIAPAFSEESAAILKSKKNRIILQQKAFDFAPTQVRSIVGGVLVQQRDRSVESAENLEVKTKRQPTAQEIDDLLFANKLVKHTKSNTIVLAKNGQLLASGTGQTSRVDALKQAITKAQSFGFDLNGAAMASDAFFPFPDCVEIANGVGIKAVIQPGGSIKDQDSIDFCNNNQMCMVFTGVRHFKH